ncbi:uncharacterized protein UV8b_03861 [Ustilaginoidea virens]|uniref:Ribosome-assembly protein 3 C-terminal domain-containing protein n=1 Tax=Ustilaginoidea virens TaxID=1159556 RepID=A0A8E5HQQ3_USTVR|nr:uncharacterized protein UV8b_03861 [Ustilaginoidea virens]QUC19620.1 hypothetical protein UV8b_03861 [Ustilaginoidea virens]
MASQDGTASTQTSASAYHLKQLTQELSDDLTKVRDADDFKSDSLSSESKALSAGNQVSGRMSGESPQGLLKRREADR